MKCSIKSIAFHFVIFGDVMENVSEKKKRKHIKMWCLQVVSDVQTTES